jgi:hypothetical protein
MEPSAGLNVLKDSLYKVWKQLLITQWPPSCLLDTFLDNGRTILPTPLEFLSSSSSSEQRIRFSVGSYHQVALILLSVTYRLKHRQLHVYVLHVRKDSLLTTGFVPFSTASVC